MGGSASLPKETRVVIVGGGYGGCAAALQLKADACDFLLIERRAFVHLRTGALRSTVEPEFTKRTMIDLATTFGTKYKQDEVTSIDADKKEVTLASGSVESFTHLIIATGSTGALPGYLPSNMRSTEKALQLYKQQHDEIAAASRLVVIGGGAVGVELAGELQETWPEKSVTLIHSSYELVAPGMGEKMQSSLRTVIQDKGIHLKLGERVSNLDEVKNAAGLVTVKTDSSSITADRAFVCIGTKVNSECYEGTLDVNERQQIKVNEYFEVAGYEGKNIFAIGDCCNSDEIKMAYTADLDAKHLIKNLRADARGCQRTPYKKGKLIMLVPVGKSSGVAYFNGWVVGSWFVRMVKGDLFVGMKWKEFGQKEPIA